MRDHGYSKGIFRWLLALAVTGIGIIAGSTAARAQVAGATLSGTVTDASGAVVPQAQVSIKNQGTGIATVVPTNTDGLYSAPNLLPGDYEVTVSAAGFATEVQTGINLTVGAQQVLNFTLKVGQATQKVEVTGAAPAVQLASSSISSVVGSNTVVELPLNGRDWTQLANLQPGVNAVLTQPGTANLGPRGNRGFGNQQAISGTRPLANNYRIDGISAMGGLNDPPGSVSSVALGVEAIQEFSVITSNYSAEYGRTSGGVINAVTRSGTNQIHGSAFEFLRNSDLDARSTFDTGPIPTFRRNQFGASVGGPIQKDKTFFFADYEGLRQALALTNKDKVPSQDARNGIIHNADGTTSTITIDPLVKPYLAFYPLPNGQLIGTGNTAFFNLATTDVTREDFTTVKIDRKISDKDSIFGTWTYDKATDERPDVLDNFITGNVSLRETIALEETHIFSPALVNSVRGGFNRVPTSGNNPISTVNPLSKDLSLGAFPGRPAPTLTVSGLTTYTGPGGVSNPIHIFNSFQGYDDAFLTKGVHSLKFGFAFERMQHYVNTATPPNGAFSFGSLSAFLTNQPTSLFGSLTPYIAYYRESLLGGYLQDDWRWRPNFTLNLGLRYEMTTDISEVHGHIAHIANLTDVTPRLGNPFVNNSTLRNFEPRLGFSWDPSHNGKTAVRGAFGIFDVLPLTYITNGDAPGPPFQSTLAVGNLPPGSFPTGAFALATQPTTVSRTWVENDPHRNYVMIWNMNVQQELTPSTTVMLGYVGNHGVHMFDRTNDGNMVLPTNTPEGLLWPSPRGSGIKVNPSLGQIYVKDWDGDALYDALELQVTKKLSHGFQAQGSYTWGKNIDTGSASAIGDPYTNSIDSLFWFCKSCRRGLADFDIAQTLVINYIWNAPTPKSLGGIGSSVLGGWQLGGIITAETGVPLTPQMGGDPLGLNNSEPYAYPNRLAGPGCATGVNGTLVNYGYINLNCFAPPNPLTLLGNAGRNTLIGPGLATVDFSLFKNNYIKRISENFNVQFRAEFFNILNRPNYATPVDNEVLFSQSGSPIAGAGAVDSLSTTPREIQFALKLIW